MPVLARRARSFLCYRTTHRFYVLESEPLKPEAQVDLNIDRLAGWSDGLRLTLQAVKGRDADWAWRIHRGHTCYVARSGGVPAAYVWASPGEWHIFDPRTASPLARDVVFWYDGFTIERFRGRRVLPALFSRAIEDMHRQGYRRDCTVIEDTNFSSQRCDSRIGYQPTDEAVCVYRFFMLFRYRSRRGAPPRSMLPCAMCGRT